MVKVTSIVTAKTTLVTMSRVKFYYSLIICCLYYVRKIVTTNMVLFVNFLPFSGKWTKFEFAL